MTKPEMNRRLATMPRELFVRVRGMISDGYGWHGISLESEANIKQINAVFEWVNRFGSLMPTELAN